MAVWRSLVIVPMTSGNPKDITVNTWHVRSLSGASFDDWYNAWKGALQTLYNTITPQLASSVDKTKIRMKTYALDDPPPRAPVRDELFTITASLGSTELPHEIAVCCSFQGDPVSGQKQARRRGRVYFGPLFAGGTAGSLLSPAAVTAFANAMDTFASASGSTTFYDWIVLSDTAATEYREVSVTNGWVDNAVDIQRRRGTAPTTRTTWAI